MQTRILELQDGPASITIAEDFGCNVFSWQVADRELLYACDRFGEDIADFYHGGIPLLFPSVGRTWDQSVAPAGPERYRLNGRQGIWTMPCHGIVPLGKWKLLRQDVTADCATVEYAFGYGEEVMDHHYPYAVSYRQVFSLRHDSLEMVGIYANDGPAPAPVAFGYHPYFRLESPAAQLELPCTEAVELDGDLLIPSGGSTPFNGTLEIRTEQDADAVFGGMNGSQARLLDPDAGRVITVDMDANTEHVVVYSGAGCPFVCIEPWTRGLGGYSHLQAPGWEQTQPIPVLQPGEERSFRACYSVADA